MSRKQLQNLLIRRLPPAPETIWNQLEARLPEPAVNAAPSPASPRRMLGALYGMLTKRRISLHKMQKSTQPQKIAACISGT